MRKVFGYWIARSSRAMTNMGVEARIATSSGMTATERQTVQALMAWYAAMGVDEAIGEAPVNCFAALVADPSPPRTQSRPRPAAARPPAAESREGRMSIGQGAPLPPPPAL